MKVRFALLFVGVSYLSSMTAISQPKIQVDGAKFSLGSLYRGQVVERKVTIRNTGTDTLVLKHVDASCGCTGTVVSNDRIPGGGSGTILITFNSKNFSGPVHKSVTITSNALDTPSAVIEFTATIVEEIVLSPPQFWFKDAETGRTASVTIKLRNDGKDPFELKAFRTQLEGLVLKLPPGPIKPGVEVELIAEFTPKKAVPILADGVFLTTTNPHQAEMYIPVYGNVKEFKFQ